MVQGFKRDNERMENDYPNTRTSPWVSEASLECATPNQEATGLNQVTQRGAHLTFGN
jgi:hypothetical protein